MPDDRKEAEEDDTLLPVEEAAPSKREAEDQDPPAFGPHENDMDAAPKPKPKKRSKIGYFGPDGIGEASSSDDDNDTSLLKSPAPAKDSSASVPKKKPAAAIAPKPKPPPSPEPAAPPSPAALPSPAEAMPSPNVLEVMVRNILGGNNSRRQGSSDSDIRTQCENELTSLERFGHFNIAFKLSSDKESCPLNWWKNNNGNYRRLAWLAIK